MAYQYVREPLLSEEADELAHACKTVDEKLVKVRLPEVRPFTEGEPLHLDFDPNHVHLFDPRTGLRIN